MIASELLADVLIVHFENGSHGKIAHLLVRSTTNDEMTPDIKIMLLGDTQSGKSTLVVNNKVEENLMFILGWCVNIKAIR